MEGSANPGSKARLKRKSPNRYEQYRGNGHDQGESDSNWHARLANAGTEAVPDATNRLDVVPAEGAVDLFTQVGDVLVYQVL